MRNTLDASVADRELVLQALDRCEWENAVDGLRRLLEPNPDDVDLLGKLSFALSRAGRYDEAIDVLHGLKAREPDSARWPYMIGYQYYVREQWAESLEGFREALRLFKGYIKVWYRAGYALFRLDRPDEAMTCLKRCIRCWEHLDENGRSHHGKTRATAEYLLGKILVMQGRSRTAAGHLRAAVEYDGRQADWQYQLGKCLLKIEANVEALTHLRAAHDLSPGKDYVIDRLAQALIANGDSDEALSLYREIPPRRRKPYVLKNLGSLYIDGGDYTRALDALRLAGSKDRKNHNIQYLLGVAEENVGDLDAAVSAYRRAGELRRQNHAKPFPSADEAVQRIENADEVDKESRDKHATSEVEQGVVAFFDEKRGYGFIQASEDKVFFHVSALTGNESVETGSRVAYKREASEKGPRATWVTLV
jgi:tetratricopeptide (TPR) repeat protein